MENKKTESEKMRELIDKSKEAGEKKFIPVDEIRLAYSISKSTVKNKVKSGDEIHTDDKGIKEIEDILIDCNINYKKNTIPLVETQNHYQLIID